MTDTKHRAASLRQHSYLLSPTVGVLGQIIPFLERLFKTDWGASSSKRLKHCWSKKTTFLAPDRTPGVMAKNMQDAVTKINLDRCTKFQPFRRRCIPNRQTDRQTANLISSHYIGGDNNDNGVKYDDVLTGRRTLWNVVDLLVKTATLTAGRESSAQTI